MYHAPTPRAASAIISQITSRGDCEGEFHAFIGGVAHDFTAWFRTEWDRVGEYGRRDYDEATCTLIGAWAYSSEDGSVVFAGNRAETVALVGEADVEFWEAAMAEREEEDV